MSDLFFHHTIPRDTAIQKALRITALILEDHSREPMPLTETLQTLSSIDDFDSEWPTTVNVEVLDQAEPTIVLQSLAFEVTTYDLTGGRLWQAAGLVTLTAKLLQLASPYKQIFRRLPRSKTLVEL